MLRKNMRKMFIPSQKILVFQIYFVCLLCQTTLRFSNRSDIFLLPLIRRGSYLTILLRKSCVVWRQSGASPLYLYILRTFFRKCQTTKKLAPRGIIVPIPLRLTPVTASIPQFIRSRLTSSKPTPQRAASVFAVSSTRTCTRLPTERKPTEPPCYLYAETTALRSASICNQSGS